ncbi:MAG: hypothetical protein WC777_01830 [Candidatus Gracilibacteria bacterium]
MTTHETKKTCKACLQEIPKKATKCSHCGQKQSISNCCAVPLVIFLVIFFLGMLGQALDEMGVNQPSSTPEFRTEASDFEAYLMAKHFVEATLKSPTTAEFPSTMFDDPYTVSKEADVYTIYSYVDSQNGFGAMIRTYYTIQLRFLGGDPSDFGAWEYVDIQTE